MGLDREEHNSGERKKTENILKHVVKRPPGAPANQTVYKTPIEMTTDTRRRVKLYALNADRQWDDRGTGHVSSNYVERLKGMCSR